MDISFLKDQSKGKLILAALIVIGIISALFLNPHDAEYHQAVQAEIEIAKKLCEQSRDIVVNNMDRLKLDDNQLRDIPVDGQVPEFRYIGIPRAVLFHSGFAYAGSYKELYCTFKDPRGAVNGPSASYFYDYNEQKWVNNRKGVR